MERMSSQPLNVVIVGAGIAGLTAAISLRRQGHIVNIYESSSFSRELGAAVHVGPNGHGILKRLGVPIKDTGATLIRSLTGYSMDGKRNFSRSLDELMSVWQHEWLMAHRVKLHDALRKIATDVDGVGPPAILHLASPAVDIDPVQGIVHFADGKQAQGDVVLGADGVHGVSRSSIPGANNKAFPTGRSAFRFMIPRADVLEDSQTKRFVENDGDMMIVTADEKSLVVYPTSNNELINMVALHPSEESPSTQGWGSQVPKSALLDVFRNFHPDFVALLSKAKDDSIKVWQLLDMETISQWTSGRVALLGDAAHPFLPYQGQGASVAIEDAAALGVVLEGGLQSDEVTSRLELYQQIRQGRANRIQEMTRQSGKRMISAPSKDAGGRSPIKDDQNFGMELGFNHNHDEIDNSTQKLREWKWLRNGGGSQLMKNVFDCAPNSNVKLQSKSADFICASVTVKSSLTLLKNLLPIGQAWNVKAPGTIAYFTFIATQHRNRVADDSSTLRFYIHGIKRDGQKSDTTSTFLPITFSMGPDGLNVPFVRSGVLVNHEKKNCRISASFNDTEWLAISLEDLKWPDQIFPDMSDRSMQHLSHDDSLLTHQYQPYLVEDGAGGATMTNSSNIPFNNQLSDLKIEQIWRSKQAKIALSPRQGEKMREINHIVERLVELPVFAVEKAQVVTGHGSLDAVSAIMLSQRLESWSSENL